MKVILGVCGGIAAYKAALLVRGLVKAGAEVQVIMTPDARSFVTPLTLSTLSGKPVLIEYFDATTGSWNNHVQLGMWADLMLVAPATAHTLGKLAQGLSDHLLAAVYLSARCPVIVAPAMDLDMWAHPSTQRNIDLLKSYGNHIIPPAEGELASGLVGTGRLPEPEEILQYVERFFPNKDLNSSGSEEMDKLQAFFSGKKVLVTAGPTYEAIDPVRFIGNHSSGKMGVALAEELAGAGARVTLVHGPLSIPVPDRSMISAVAVRSAAQMYDACVEMAHEADIIVMAAAVADYAPASVSEEKIKKSSDNLVIRLEKTQDILAELGKRKRPGQILIGFALETENEAANAADKLERKNLDFIVLNSLRDEGAGFGGDTNKISLLRKNGETKIFDLKSKTLVARDILSEISSI